MCTVTIVPIDGQTVITMNRDELIERVESDPQIHNLNNGIYGWYPADTVSNGTWFGVNNHGLVLTILNRYQYQEHNSQAFISRGKIIPYLLGYTGVLACLKALDKLYLAHFMPFTLLLVQGTMLVRVVWNGAKMNQYVETYSTPFFITSSSVNIEAVTAWRNQAFDRFLCENNCLSAELLLAFHLTVSKNNLSYSINMQRQGRQTKSITQVAIEHERAKVLYYRRKCAEHFEFEIVDCLTLNLAKEKPCFYQPQ